MTNRRDAYDLFISYTHDDAEWVMRELYEPLCRCRFPNGRKPRIFIDHSPDGIEIGANFMEAISNAVVEAPHFIAVYSAIYFLSEQCRRELDQANRLDPDQENHRIFPILIDPRVQGRIPQRYRSILKSAPSSFRTGSIVSAPRLTSRA